MTSRGALGLLLLLALAACSNYGGGSVTLPPSGPASYKIGEAQNYTVIAGDTIDSVAQQFNMPVEALIAANHLVYPYALHGGQTLFIPGRGAPGPGTGYVVVAGDTLTRIARHNGTTVAALAALNGLVPPYVIKVGQRLTLPGGSPTQTAAVAGATPAASASGGEMIRFRRPSRPASPGGRLRQGCDGGSVHADRGQRHALDPGERADGQPERCGPAARVAAADEVDQQEHDTGLLERARRDHNGQWHRGASRNDTGGAIDLQHPGLQHGGRRRSDHRRASHCTQHERRLASRPAAAGTLGGCSTGAPRLGKIPLARQRQGGVGLWPRTAAA
jgi:LysM repeat protein